jgi:hypothetical protein
MPTAQNIPTKGRAGPRQAYLNKTKFQPYRHCTERKPDDSFLRPMTSLCCPRCTKKLLWKHEYAKYVPQTNLRKCNLCSQKKVAIAYHRICQDCARQHIRCAKCQQDPKIANSTDQWRRQDDSDDEERGDEPRRGEADASASDDEGPAGTAGPAGQTTSDSVPKTTGFEVASDDDEELRALKGLDVSGLRAQKRRIRAMEQAAERENMRERERRTLNRRDMEKSGKGDIGSDDDFSSDEEEL